MSLMIITDTKIIFNKKLLFFIKDTTLGGTRTHNLQIRSLTRYPITPLGQGICIPHYNKSYSLYKN